MFSCSTSARAGRRALRAALAGACTLVAAAALPAAASAATRHVSASGADSGTCASSLAPCKTFGYAYRQAGAGDLVEVRGGSYPSQSIPIVSGRTGAPVEFRPALGSIVSLGGLNVAGSHVTVRDIRTGSVSISGGGQTVSNVQVINGSGQSVWLQQVRNVTLRGGSYGGRNNDAPVKIGAYPSSYDVTFDGVDFHDATATDPAAHTECIWAGGVQGFTVRNSIFRNCAYFNIFFTRFNGENVKNVVLENNVFETTKQWNGQDAPYAINISSHLTRAENFTIRNNVFGGDVAIQPSVSNVRLVGNIGPIGSCKSGVSYAYNVWTRLKCGSTDKVASGAMSQFVNPAGHDFHLKAGAAAIDAASPTDHPATDREGRPRVGPPDAGAHESGSAAPAPAPAPAQDTTPPTNPSKLTVSGGTRSSVSLGWTASTDASGKISYDVFADAAKVASTSQTSHTFAGFSDCSKPRQLAVQAVDAAGNRSAKAAVTVECKWSLR